MRVRYLAVAASIAIAACGDDVCLTYAEWGIVLHVQDSVTQANLVPGATVVIRDGAYSDSIVVAGSLYNLGDAVGLAMERSGNYTITVRHAGYAVWTRANVRVVDEEDDCHVRRVTLVAKLQPLP